MCCSKPLEQIQNPTSYSADLEPRVKESLINRVCERALVTPESGERSFLTAVCSFLLFLACEHPPSLCACARVCGWGCRWSGGGGGVGVGVCMCVDACVIVCMCVCVCVRVVCMCRCMQTPMFCNLRGHLQRCQMPDIENSRKTAEKGAERVTVKQPKNSRKNSRNTRKQLF